MVAVAVREAPEPVRRFERKRRVNEVRGRLHLVTVMGVPQFLRVVVGDDRGKRSRPAVVGDDQMQH